MPATKMTAAKSRARSFCSYLLTEAGNKLNNNLGLTIANPDAPRTGTQLFFKLEKDDGYRTDNIVDVACSIAQVVDTIVKHKITIPKNVLVVQIDHLKSAADAKIIQAALTTAYTFDRLCPHIKMTKTACFADDDNTDFDLVCLFPLTDTAAAACDNISCIRDIVKIMNGDY